MRLSLIDIFRKAAQRGWVRPGHKYIRRWWDSKANRWRYEYYEAGALNDDKGADAYVHVTREGRIAVATEYDPKLKDQLKALGGKWDADTKSWTYDPKTYVEKVRPVLKHVVYHPNALDALKTHLADDEKQEIGSTPLGAAQRQGIARDQINRPNPLNNMPDQDYKPNLVSFLAKEGIGVHELQPGATYKWQWADGDWAQMHIPGTGEYADRVKVLELRYYSAKDDLVHEIRFNVDPEGQLEYAAFRFSTGKSGRWEDLTRGGKPWVTKIIRTLLHKPPADQVVADGMAKLAPPEREILPPDMQGSPEGALLLEALAQHGISVPHLRPGKSYTITLPDAPPAQLRVEGDTRPERVIITMPLPDLPGVMGSISFGVNRGQLAVREWAKGESVFRPPLGIRLKEALARLKEAPRGAVNPAPEPIQNGLRPSPLQAERHAQMLIDFLNRMGISTWETQPGTEWRWEWDNGNWAHLEAQGEGSDTQRLILTTWEQPERFGERFVYGVNPDGQIALVGYAVRFDSPDAPWSVSKQKPEPQHEKYAMEALKRLLDAPSPKRARPHEPPPIEATKGVEQPELFELEGSPLFPEVKPKRDKKPREKKHPAPPTNKTERKPAVQPALMEVPPVQPSLLDEDLPSLAKALGYRPNVPLVLRARR